MIGGRDLSVGCEFSVHSHFVLRRLARNDTADLLGVESNPLVVRPSVGLLALVALHHVAVAVPRLPQIVQLSTIVR